MAGERKKISRILPLIKVRQIQFDQETTVLYEIQHRRSLAMQDLTRCQRMYIDGVDRLNKERQSVDRRMLETLESSTDYAKRQWYQKLQILRGIEEEERKQMAQVKEAQKNLRMLEKINENYGKQLKVHENKVEQKMLDEFAIGSARRKDSE